MAGDKMTNCRSCGAEIAKSAVTCPRCGARNKRKHVLLWVVLGVLALIIIGAAGSGGSEPAPAAASSTSAAAAGSRSDSAAAPKSESKAPVKKTFGVGESAELKDIVVTLVSVEESSGSQFNQPTDGNVFVICEFEIENNSSSEINVSSLLSFAAYCDDYSLNFSLTALLEKGNRNQLDGQIAAGKKMNGIIGYEVPIGWNELEIRFTPSFWSGNEIIFTAVHG